MAAAACKESVLAWFGMKCKISTYEITNLVPQLLNLHATAQAFDTFLITHSDDLRSIVVESLDVDDRNLYDAHDKKVRSRVSTRLSRFTKELCTLFEKALGAKQQKELLARESQGSQGENSGTEEDEEGGAKDDSDESYESDGPPKKNRKQPKQPKSGVGDFGKVDLPTSSVIGREARRRVEELTNSAAGEAGLTEIDLSYDQTVNGSLDELDDGWSFFPEEVRGKVLMPHRPVLISLGPFDQESFDETGQGYWTGALSWDDLEGDQDTAPFAVVLYVVVEEPAVSFVMGFDDGISDKFVTVNPRNHRIALRHISLSRDVNIERFHIKQDLRGKGWGRRAMAVLLGLLSSTGFDSPRVVVNSPTSVAKPFYVAVGFAIMNDDGQRNLTFNKSNARPDQAFVPKRNQGKMIAVMGRPYTNYAKVLPSCVFDLIQLGPGL